MALGDVDGDGDLDLVAGNYDEANRLYLNNGTADPWSGVSASDISTDSYQTTSVALGDVDGDGDLDLVAGNYDQANRLYLNNSTADPWNGVSGSDITADSQNTRSVALGDVDGDGDLDLIAGNGNQANRLYLNSGTADPWNGVGGSDISADSHQTTSIVLGDVDGDGELDLVAGNSSQANRLYQRKLYNTAHGRAASLRVDTETSNVANATLTAVASLSLSAEARVLVGNTEVTYFMSNNGGVKWYQVRSGVNFVFPTTGMDLRWRAALCSLSPVRTPRIDQIQIVKMPLLACPDFNNSGLVDVQDIMQAAARWNNPAAYDPTYDAAPPFASPIDIYDVIEIAQQWNIACP